MPSLTRRIFAEWSCIFCPGCFYDESDKTPMKPGVTFGNWGFSR